MKKYYKVLLATVATITLAACSPSQDDVSYKDSDEKSGQVEPIVEEKDDQTKLNQDSSSEKSDSSKDENSEESESTDSESTSSESETNGEFTPEEESIIQTPMPESTGQERAISSSEVDSSERDTVNEESAAEESTDDTQGFDNSRAEELLNEAAPLIHEASGNMFKGNSYVFTPILLNDNLVQIEVHKQSPNDQEQMNLITIYRYDSEHGHLMEQNVVNADWSNVTPKE